jgi:hypothetical protein
MVGLTGWHVGIALASDGSAAAQMDRNASAVLLAGAFAAIAVFNMAFFRHLVRVHSGSAKGASRRPDRSGHGPSA